MMLLFNFSQKDSVSTVSVSFIFCSPKGDCNITALKLEMLKCWEDFKPNKCNKEIWNPVFSHGSLYLLGEARLLTSSTSTTDSSVPPFSETLSLFHSPVQSFLLCCFQYLISICDIFVLISFPVYWIIVWLCLPCLFICLIILLRFYSLDDTFLVLIGFMNEIKWFAILYI